MNRPVMMLVACALVTVSHRVWSAEPRTNEVLTVFELVNGDKLKGVITLGPLKLGHDDTLSALYDVQK